MKKDNSLKVNETDCKVCGPKRISNFFETLLNIKMCTSIDFNAREECLNGK